MGVVINIPVNMFKLVEQRLKYKFWDKGRERSNHAAALAASGAVAVRCIMKHDQLAYTGPPDDQVRAWVCLRCHGAASEPEIIHRGFDFDTAPDWIIDEILNLDLQRQNQGNPKMFAMGNGR